MADETTDNEMAEALQQALSEGLNRALSQAEGTTVERGPDGHLYATASVPFRSPKPLQIRIVTLDVELPEPPDDGDEP